MPFREKRELMKDFDTAIEAFLAKGDQLKENSRHMEVFRERGQQLENAFNQVHGFAILERPEQIATELV